MAVLGVKVPNTGSLPVDPGLGPLSRLAEELGAASLWVSDHIVLTERNESYYPYSNDGRIGWQLDMSWYEALTSCAWAAATTTTAKVGTGVLVLPQRDPVLVAKTAATIDALSGGRMVLGVGVGWYEEEFDALGWDFRTRGRRTDEAIEVMRRLWNGFPEPFDGEFFTLPHGLSCHPRPTQQIPVLVGGMTRPALERAAAIGDGWLAHANLHDVDPVRLGAQLDRVRELRPGLPAVARVVGEIAPPQAGSAAEITHALAVRGFDEVVVDPPWPDPHDVAAVMGRLNEALA